MGLGKVSENVTFEVRHNLKFEATKKAITYTRFRVEDLVHQLRVPRPDHGDHKQPIPCGTCGVETVYRVRSVAETSRLRVRQRLRALASAVAVVLLVMLLPWSDLTDDFVWLIVVACLAIMGLAFAALVWILLAADETGVHPVRERGMDFFPPGHFVKVLVR